MDKENKDFYKNLKNLLDETSSWPSEYIYKFIYKSNENNIEILKDIFKDSSANFNIKKSKNEKYTSVSVKIIAKDPDLIIRTGGEKRLSNFYLWQSSYSELYFSNRLWPDFTKKDLKKAIEDFFNRKRKFGIETG